MEKADLLGISDRKYLAEYINRFLITTVAK